MIWAALLLQAAAPVPPRAAMSGPQAYDGLWFDIFEGERFFPNASDPHRVNWREDAIWLDIDRIGTLRRLVETTMPGGRVPDPMSPRVYRVRFTGRQAANMHCRPDPAHATVCYGHLGGSPGLVAVDRILSIQDLGPVAAFSSDNPH